MEIEIREQDLPGIGRRWELPLSKGRSIVALVRTGTGCHHLFIRSANEDEPDCSAELSRPEAIALAWLLAGVTIVSEPSEDVGMGR